MAKRIRLIFSLSLGEEPVLSKTILKTGIVFNVLKAEVGPVKSEMIGEVAGSEKEHEAFVKELKNAGVKVDEVESVIVLDEDACVNCLYCVSLCPTGALFKGKDGKLETDFSKCVLCKNCVLNCPVKAFKLLAGA